MDSEWIYGEDLFRQYPRARIIDLLRTGKLQPYDTNRQPVYCPYNFHEYSQVFDNYPPNHPHKKKRLLELVEADQNLEEGNLDRLSWFGVWEPDDPIKKEKLLEKLSGCRYKRKDVETALKHSSPSKSGARRNIPFTEVIRRAFLHYTHTHPERDFSVTDLMKYIERDVGAKLPGSHDTFDPDGVIKDTIKGDSGQPAFKIEETKGKEKMIYKKGMKQRLERLIEKDFPGYKMDEMTVKKCR